MNCDNCKHYDWYYNYCEKWKCMIDSRSVHNCFEPFETPILDFMIGKGKTDDSTNYSSWKSRL